MTAIDTGSVTEAASRLITFAAVVLGPAVWLMTRSWQPAMPIVLELLLAAGLLRLSSRDDWNAIAAAASIVAIRTLIKYAGSKGVGAGAVALLGRARPTVGASPRGVEDGKG